MQLSALRLPAGLVCLNARLWESLARTHRASSLLHDIKGTMLQYISQEAHVLLLLKQLAARAHAQLYRQPTCKSLLASRELGASDQGWLACWRPVTQIACALPDLVPLKLWHGDDMLAQLLPVTLLAVRALGWHGCDPYGISRPALGGLSYLTAIELQYGDSASGGAKVALGPSMLIYLEATALCIAGMQGLLEAALGKGLDSDAGRRAAADFGAVEPHLLNLLQHLNTAIAGVLPGWDVSRMPCMPDVVLGAVEAAARLAARVVQVPPLVEARALVKDKATMLWNSMSAAVAMLELSAGCAATEERAAAAERAAASAAKLALSLAGSYLGQPERELSVKDRLLLAQARRLLERTVTAAAELVAGRIQPAARETGWPPRRLQEAWGWEDPEPLIDLEVAG
jgi:hypothetical protein